MRARFKIFKVDQMVITSNRIAKTGIILIILANIYVFLQNPWKRKSSIGYTVPLWSQNIDFETANIKNDTGNRNGCFLVPNYVHFIRFSKHKFTFVEMICVLAAFKNQEPEKIIFHWNNNLTFSGPYWEVLKNQKTLMNIVEFSFIEEPTEIFGQPIEPLMRLYHGSDITRIRILMKYGGIFLDNDSYVVRNLDDFRRYEMTLNWDENQYLGTQVLLAHKDARFLKLWLESYRGAYRGDLWYYNAGERPTKEILWKHPELIHRVKVKFGADTGYIDLIFQKQWAGWRKMYTIHLLVHHQYLLSNLTKRAIFPVEFDEDNIRHYPVTFREMAYDMYDIANISWSREVKE